MSDNKLNQSLDDILKTQRVSGRGRRNRKSGAKQAAVTAPVGGVKKVTKPVKGPNKAAAPAATGQRPGESKINISNLPFDVDEAQIKEYLSKTIGNIKRVVLAYGPNGKSRGSCTVIFHNASSAAEAAKQLDGVKVDNKPMRVEVLISAQEAPAALPTKSFSERVSQPKGAKAQPKPATATKTATSARGGKAARAHGRSRNAGRGKPKTTEQLDAEMADYWQTGNGAEGGAADVPMAANGAAAQPVTGGEDEEML